MEEKNALCSLANYINVNGKEAVGRRVREERSRLERIANRGEEEWRTDILMFPGFHRLLLDHEGTYAFTHFYWPTMANQENGFRRCHQKRVLGKMLKKVLVPYIYRNRVWCLDETRWPISFAEFVGLNEQLLNKFPEIHAGHQWQAIIQYYEDIKQELQSLAD